MLLLVLMTIVLTNVLGKLPGKVGVAEDALTSCYYWCF